MWGISVEFSDKMENLWKHEWRKSTEYVNIDQITQTFDNIWYLKSFKNIYIFSNLFLVLILFILNQISICNRKCKMIHSGYQKIRYWNSLPHSDYWQGRSGYNKMAKLWYVRSPSVLEYESKSMQSKQFPVSNFINLLLHWL